jgi:hypothetical protein
LPSTGRQHLAEILEQLTPRFHSIAKRCGLTAWIADEDADTIHVLAPSDAACDGLSPFLSRNDTSEASGEPGPPGQAAETSAEQMDLCRLLFEKHTFRSKCDVWKFEHEEILRLFTAAGHTDVPFSGNNLNPAAGGGGGLVSVVNELRCPRFARDDRRLLTLCAKMDGNKKEGHAPINVWVEKGERTGAHEPPAVNVEHCGLYEQLRVRGILETTDQR